MKKQADPDDDPAEVQDAAASNPEADSPGDDAVLEQEKLYEGITSESLPSGKIEGERS